MTEGGGVSVRPSTALAPDSCELRDCGQVQSRVCGEADAAGALDGFCQPRTMTKREPFTPRSSSSY
jgi:hypothetical protein